MSDTNKFYAGVEKETISLLRAVLPKETNDEQLSQKILDGVRIEITRKKQAAAFQEFCLKCPLPDLKDETLHEVKYRFDEVFGASLIEFTANHNDGTLTVEYTIPGGPLISAIEINDIPLDEEEVKPEIKIKFTPFPVALPGDPKLIWIMAKRETMTTEEAGRALHEAQVEFWESKSGQLQLRKGAERTFPEFIQRVPARFLREVGLKRHYKDPEVVKVLKQGGK